VFDAASGFGGYRESGFGREGGREGLFEYVRPKWQPRPRPQLTEFDPKAFGKAVPARPSPVNGFSPNGGLPKIDRTAKMFIGGKQKRPDGNYSRPIFAPDGHEIGQAADGNRKDIRDAVEAARSAQSAWASRTPHNRAQILYFIAENLSARADEFAARLVAMTGESIEAARSEVDMSIDRLFTYAAYCDKYGGTVQETELRGLTVALNEAIGVVGIACPDEYPLLAFIALIAPAIARGNSVVAIPSQKYPLSATDFYQVLETSDVPGGVVNIVTGDRDHLTKTLSEHEDVDAVWYFGGAVGSRYVEYASASNMKRTWVDYGETRDWTDMHQGAGEEFLREAIQVKNIWAPMGE
jgi:aldehyde dehydrogenase (NAD+)